MANKVYTITDNFKLFEYIKYLLNVDRHIHQSEVDYVVSHYVRLRTRFLEGKGRIDHLDNCLLCTLSGCFVSN